MGKGLLFVALTCGFMLGAMTARAEDRFDQLVDLHKAGPISARLHALADDNLQFVCFGKNDPNKPIHVSIGYHGMDKSAVRAVAHDATAESADLARLISGHNFPLELSHIPAFDGQLLAGHAMWENAMDQLSAGDEANVRVGISLHEPSQKHLAIVFKINTDNSSVENPEACQLKEQIEYACIESATEL